MQPKISYKCLFFVIKNIFVIGYDQAKLEIEVCNATMQG